MAKIQGFDKRIVEYENIHSIKQKDFDKLIDAINPQQNEKILDAMAGYEAVAKGVLIREPGEQVHDAARRELNEETSLLCQPQPNRCLHLQPIIIIKQARLRYTIEHEAKVSVLYCFHTDNWNCFLVVLIK